MKRILFLMISGVLLFAQCEHPYEQDLIGAFPFAELMDPNPEVFGSDASEYDVRVSTNMVITTKITYNGGRLQDWIKIESTEEKGGIVHLTLNIDENLRREVRTAEVKILADGSTVVEILNITQKAYSLANKENTYKGDLILENQDEVNNCIYTKVEGNLIIGREYVSSDINNLSPLSVVTSITGGVKVNGCSNLKDMGALGGLSVDFVEFDGVNPVLVSTWKGNVKEVIIRSVTTGEVNLSSFKSAERLTLKGNSCGFKGFEGMIGLTVADMADNSIVETDGMEHMTSLDSLYLNDNPLVNVNSLASMTWVKKIDLSGTDLALNQIYYLKEYLNDDTDIVCDEIISGSTLNLEAVDIKYFSAKFESRYDDKLITISSGTNTYGYILKTSDEFSADELVPLKTYTNPLTFDLKNLTPDTQYYLWLYAVDKNGGIHLSEKLAFKTPEIIYDYQGDLVLETQYDVDECVHVTVSGNLVIGKEGSDIQDISKLTITDVGGGVTVRGCHLLTDFGTLADLTNIKYLELDDVSASLPYQWTGSVKDLRIRNISTGTVNLSRFTTLTHLTLQSNNCGFSGWNKLTAVTDADLSGNQLTTTDNVKDMTKVRNLDLSNNPLVNVNSLSAMTSLQRVDLSETNLSRTQINYLKNILPSAVNVVSDNLKGAAALSVQDETVRYRSATFAVTHSNVTSISECGYLLNKTGKFSDDGFTELDSYSIPDSFDIKNLEADTPYYIWFYVKDNVGSFHLSNRDTFTTLKIVENHVGDLVLKTQNDVDECVSTSVTGNLTIGGNGSDISNLTSLGIKSVTGDLTIIGCSSLTGFGGIKSLNVKNVILDNTNQAITKTWEGNTETLTIRNITGTTSCSLAAFDEITSLTLSDNKCSFTNLNKLVNLVEADLPRNKFSDTESMANWTKLQTLNLSGNPLSNINHLLEMSQIKVVDLSDTPLSETQIRYIVASLPTTVSVKYSGITGTGSISVSNTGMKYFSASFTAVISGISNYGGGYFISNDASFPGEDGRVEKTNGRGEALTTFEASALEDGTTYYLWYYIEDGYDSYHLSAPIIFTTNKVHYYSVSLVPTWPSYADDASATPLFKSISSNMIVYKEDVSACRADSMMPAGDNYSVELPEGMTAMGLFALEGVAEDNSYDGYVWSSNVNMTSPKWALTLQSENGSGSDIAVASLTHDLQSDVSLETTFARPVAKVSMTLDFNGSVGGLDRIDDITITMNNHYSKCQFSDAADLSYSTIMNLNFTASDIQVHADKKVVVAENRYVFPHYPGYTKSVSVKITFKDGTSKTVNPSFNTDIEANKIYDFTFVTALTDSQGSFTVDVIERVEDNIEF